MKAKTKVKLGYSIAGIALAFIFLVIYKGTGWEGLLFVTGGMGTLTGTTFLISFLIDSKEEDAETTNDNEFTPTGKHYTLLILGIVISALMLYISIYDNCC